MKYMLKVYITFKCCIIKIQVTRLHVRTYPMGTVRVTNIGLNVYTLDTVSCNGIKRRTQVVLRVTRTNVRLLIGQTLPITLFCDQVINS